MYLPPVRPGTGTSEILACSRASLFEPRTISPLDIINLTLFISSGHVRNIHFPFDIEVDTSTDVASEMVEELDLTDHDVSIIAAMIDSEIRCHIPGWAPRQQPPSSNNNLVDQGDDASSPTANGSPKSGLPVLEKLPSGRKYWSDSPKTSREGSPLRHGPSNLLLAEAVTSGESWSDENPPSPVSHKDVNSSYDSSPLRHVDYDDGCRKQGDSDLLDSQIVGFSRLSVTENIMPNKTDSDEVKCIMEKLEIVLDEQVKEIDELKKKHELAVIDIVKELPHETRQRVLSICDQKIFEHKFRYEEGHFADTLPDQSSSKMSHDIPK